MSRSPRPVRIRADGYALIEMLVATAIACVLLGVLLQFAIAAQRAVRVQAEAIDLQQRLRVAVDAIRKDVMMAGSGPWQGGGRGPLIDRFAPILPARTGLDKPDAELSFFADRISVTYVADPRSQTTLVSTMPAAGSPLVFDARAPACAADPDCGFTVGGRALIFDPLVAGAHDIFSIAAIDPSRPSLAAAAPPARAYPAGSRIAAVVQRTYYLDRSGKRLMRYDGDRSDLPVVDHVVDLRFAYYGDPRPDSVRPPPSGGSSCAYDSADPPAPLLADLGGRALRILDAAQLVDGPVCGQPPYRFDVDLLRVRRIAVTIRLEAEAPELRGGAVPPLAVTFDITPPNMAAR